MKSRGRKGFESGFVHVGLSSAEAGTEGKAACLPTTERSAYLTVEQQFVLTSLAMAFDVAHVCYLLNSTYCAMRLLPSRCSFASQRPKRGGRMEADSQCNRVCSSQNMMNHAVD